MIRRTTTHYDNVKRNKSHLFKIVYKTEPNVRAPTGETACGRTTYVPLRASRPEDVKCRRCHT